MLCGVYNTPTIWTPNSFYNKMCHQITHFHPLLHISQFRIYTQYREQKKNMNGIVVAVVITIVFYIVQDLLLWEIARCYSHKEREKQQQQQPKNRVWYPRNVENPSLQIVCIYTQNKPSSDEEVNEKRFSFRCLEYQVNRVRGCIKIRTEKVSTNVIGEPTTYESLGGYSRSIRAKSTVQCNDILDILYAWYMTVAIATWVS